MLDVIDSEAEMWDVDAWSLLSKCELTIVVLQKQATIAVHTVKLCLLPYFPGYKSFFA